MVGIVWAQGKKAPPLTDSVVLRLEGYTGPVWSSDPRYQGCVPVAPVETSWSTTEDDNSQDLHNQLLLPSPVLVNCNAQGPRADDGQDRHRPGDVKGYRGIDVCVYQLRLVPTRTLNRAHAFREAFQTRR